MPLTAEYRTFLLGGTLTAWLPLEPKQLVGLQEISITHNHNEYEHYKREISSNCTAKGAFNSHLTAVLYTHPTAEQNAVEIRLLDVNCNTYLPIISIGQGNLSGCTYGCDNSVALEFKSDLELLDRKLPFFSNYLKSGGGKFYFLPFCSDENYSLYMAILIFRLIPLIGVIINLYITFFGSIVTGCWYLARGIRLWDLCKAVAFDANLTHTDADNSFFKQNPNDTLFANHAYVKDNYIQETWNCLKTLNFIKQEYNGKWRVDGGVLKMFWKYTDWSAQPLLDLSDKRFCNEFIKGKGYAYFDPLIPPAKDNKYSTAASIIYNEISEWNSPYSTQQEGKLSPDFEAYAASFRMDGTAVDATRNMEIGFNAFTFTGSVPGFCDFGNYMRFFNSDNSSAYLVDIDPNTPQLNAKARRQGFTIAANAYYQSRGLEGYRTYNCSGILGGTSQDTEVVNWSVMCNEAMEQIQFHNRYPLFAPENPRTAPIKKRRKAEITISCLGCDIKNKLGIFENQFSAIDCHILIFKDATKAYIKSFTINYKDNTATVVVEY